MIRSFTHDKRGNFGAIFAILSVPLIGVAGIAIDYTRASSALSFAHAAGDAAVLAGVQEAKRLYESGTSPQEAESKGRAYSIEFFYAQVQTSRDGIFGYFDPSVKIDGNTIKGTLGIDVNLRTTLSKILNRDSLPIRSFSSAEIKLSQYYELHFVIDNSASMGIGANASEITRLVNATRSSGEPLGCAFACHVPDELRADVDPALDTLDRVRAENIELRIDTVKQAVDLILDDLDTTTSSNFMRVGLHTFSNNVTTVSNPTPAINVIKNNLANIDLSDDLGAGGTDFHAIFDQLEGIIGVAGDGSSPSSPLKSIVFITDGVSTNASFAYGGVGGHSDLNRAYTPFLPTIGAPNSFGQIQGFDSDICRDLKSKNDVTIATLNVSYIIPTEGIHFGDTRFRNIEMILKDDIEDNMKNCATSPNLSQAAENPTEIKASIAILLESLRETTLRLVN